MRKQGAVYLVGAGPGDPGLMTVKGLDAIRRADVVVYDHLVSERLLDACRSGAEVIYVGKEKGRHTKSQTQINELLIRHARAGRLVVRLKGGDPVLFGRGGEEALALAKAKIPYEIVPGVTSALAVPAYAGIPVTHRGVSSSIAVITGHEDPSKPDSAIRWKELATAADTLICLMGVSTLATTAEQLIRHGRPKQTPCAVIEWGTLPTQRTVIGTLATIAARCRRAGLKPPAITVVGDVVRLRRALNWFETKPLFGLRIVVTRPTDRAEQAAELLSALGADVVKLPAIELTAVPVPARRSGREPGQANGVFHRAVDRMAEFDWVFFTSPDGIRWFRRLLASERRDLRVLQGRRIGAIGPKTASSITELGIRVDFTPATFTQEGMLSGLKKRRLAGKRALILSAEGGRDVLEQGLKAQGVDVVRVPVYRTVAPARLAKQVGRVFQGRVDYVTVTSSSCVDHLAEALAAAGLSRLIKRIAFASIGPVTSSTVRGRGGRVAVEAKRATIEGLVEAIVASTRRQGEVRRGTRATATIAAA